MKNARKLSRRLIPKFDSEPGPELIQWYLDTVWRKRNSILPDCVHTRRCSDKSCQVHQRGGGLLSSMARWTAWLQIQGARSHRWRNIWLSREVPGYERAQKSCSENLCELCRWWKCIQRNLNVQENQDQRRRMHWISLNVRTLQVQRPRSNSLGTSWTRSMCVG